MTIEPNEAMKAMARRVVAAHYDLPEHEVRENCAEVSIALAAIMETQRLDAALAEAVAADCHKFPNVSERRASALWADTIAERIRTGEHYALAGGGHG